jgi:hypothetical protein
MGTIFGSAQPSAPPDWGKNACRRDELPPQLTSFHKNAAPNSRNPRFVGRQGVDFCEKCDMLTTQ